MSSYRSNFLILVLFSCQLWRSCARFAVSGPVLTVTLKDPDIAPESAAKWLDLSALRPNAVWSLQSLAPPLPNWIPSLKSLRANVSYNHQDLGFTPSNVDADLRFSKEDLGDLEIQPSYHLKQRKASCLIQAFRGNSVSMTARLAFGRKRLVEAVRGSLLFDLPFSTSLSALKVTTAFDFTRNTPSVLLEGITGSGRTKAILDLQYGIESTLTVVHALNDR